MSDPRYDTGRDLPPDTYRRPSMGMGSGSSGWILGVLVAILIIGGIAWLATSGDRNVANSPSTATENTGSATRSAPATSKAPATAPATTPAPSTTPPQK